MTGPCAKQIVTATIISKSGNRHVGKNDCLTPQPVCPRVGMPSGTGYELCVSICSQTAHAEVNACLMAGKDADGATLYIEGHTYACASCQSVCQAAGISNIIFGPPPGATQ